MRFCMYQSGRIAFLLLLVIQTSCAVRADENTPVTPLRNAGTQNVTADLLVVGGTESGCAAAVQAARMGVNKIVLVNDTEWLGGQFSSEALGAIDENRAHGYNGQVPIPRSGLFREIIDAIERRNTKIYGVPRPGRTNVITTCRPVIAAEIFANLLQPYESTGQIQRFSNYRVKSVDTDGQRVRGVVFESIADPQKTLSVRAKLTIDASDWGDVIRLSGAEYDFGLDHQSEYHEPRAPESGPTTDINPITWCMILVEQPEETLIPKPEGYDLRSFDGKWSWIDEKFLYRSRRLADAREFTGGRLPDIILINNPNVDYPLDVLPAHVAAALEATEAGSSTKQFVDLTPQQREIVYADAKRRTLQYLYEMQQRFPRFRKMALSDEFGTPDRLPPKPYIRESLRLKAQHVIREQEVVGQGDQTNYASTMFHDGVFSWQFELDFHPTTRKWRTEAGPEGPWEAVFRGQRKFGVGGTGMAIFPVRSLVPETMHGLLGAQKNLGYTSVVSSSCRLHDQSMAAGQASGAVAAVHLIRGFSPHDMWKHPQAMSAIWDGLLGDGSGVPLAIWPFADVDPHDPGFIAIQQLALRRLFPLQPDETHFQADQAADAEWISAIIDRTRNRGYECTLEADSVHGTRRDAAIAIWNEIKDQPMPRYRWKVEGDADADGIPDESDPLPFHPGTNSWTVPE